MRTFCLINGRYLRYTVDDAEAFVLAVVSGELGLTEITTWLVPHLVDG